MKTKGFTNNRQEENGSRKNNSIEQPNQHKRKDDRSGISREDAGGTGMGHKAGQGKEDNQVKKQ